MTSAYLRLEYGIALALPCHRSQRLPLPLCAHTPSSRQSLFHPPRCHVGNGHRHPNLLAAYSYTGRVRPLLVQSLSITRSRPPLLWAVKMLNSSVISATLPLCLWQGQGSSLLNVSVLAVAPPPASGSALSLLVAAIFCLVSPLVHHSVPVFKGLFPILLPPHNSLSLCLGLGLVDYN